MHAFDRQTDGQTEFSSLDRVSIPCSAVKYNNRFRQATVSQMHSMMSLNFVHTVARTCHLTKFEFQRRLPSLRDVEDEALDSKVLSSERLVF